MAMKCREVGDEDAQVWCPQLSSPWDEEAEPRAAYNVLKTDPAKKTLDKCLLAKMKGAVHTKSTEVEDLRFRGLHRSITDLPPALVSEILRCLDAKELGIVCCVSTLLHSIASDHQNWKVFYRERWGLPHGVDTSGLNSWKELFVEREMRSRAFLGRFSTDTLRGHTEAVRAVYFLQHAKLVFSGGYDSVVRMWDVEEGLSVTVSRPLGCTIRAITADMELLVAAGTDGFLQCWRAVEGISYLFDIAGLIGNQNSEFRLWGHEGPVTCLALDATQIYSGSWDMTVRVWDRVQMKCVRKLRHADWVWALSPSGSIVTSTAGRDVYFWDTESEDLITVINNAHVGNAYSLARSHAGNLLFTGGEDGAIHMFEFYGDCIEKNIKPAATWIPHTGPVQSLAFEFPWLVTSSTDGRIALINVQKLLNSTKLALSRRCAMIRQSPATEPPHRMLHGFGCNLFSVGIGADRIVCAGEENVVRVWNFSQALEIEKRVQALKSVRLENRNRRRKAQVSMNRSAGDADQCSFAAKKNQPKGDRGSIWHPKRGMSGKLKA